MRTLLSAFISLLIFTACRKEDNITTDPSVKLQFSADTILFDTIFTSVGSTSRRLKVYNRNKNAVRISRIELSGLNTSSYQININGQGDNFANDIEIAGKDSINIFVKVLINPGRENLPFIVSDSIKFLTNGNTQTVQLKAYGQNAVFYKDETLTGNVIWTNEKPYVIYNSLLIAENSKVTIQKGARIYFHKGSKLLVAGTLQSKGKEKENVYFSGDRLEAVYKDEPGQWEGIHFLRSSRDNLIDFTTIKNALAGIRVDSLSNNSNPKLIINGSVIQNMEVAGLVMYNADVAAFNNLIHNCGQFLVYGVLGGKYNFKQNTFAGMNYNFNRQNPAVYFADYYRSGNSSQTSPLQLNLSNNIIWGSNENELVLDKKSTLPFLVSVQKNFLKTKNESFLSGGNILNVDPLFRDPQKENYELNVTSPAINTGLNLMSDPYWVSFLTRDIKYKQRIFPSELGCYEVD